MRRKNIVSQHIEVALVYKDMLGLDEARQYLERESVPPEIATRVLLSEQKRAPAGVQAARAAAPVECRRRNRVHDAIVEAALKIERKLGRDMALALLRDENVSEDVAARMSADGPRQLRARKPPP